MKTFLLKPDDTYGNVSKPFRKNLNAFTKEFNKKKFGQFVVPDRVYTDIDDYINIDRKSFPMAKTREDVEMYVNYFGLASKAKINDDLSVDVHGLVWIKTGWKMKTLPIKFNRVSGDFDISYLGLTSLKNCPEYVGGMFYCQRNELVDLKGCPKKIMGGFDFTYNNVEFSVGYIPKGCNIKDVSLWDGMGRTDGIAEEDF